MFQNYWTKLNVKLATEVRNKCLSLTSDVKSVDYKAKADMFYCRSFLRVYAINAAKKKSQLHHQYSLKPYVLHCNRTFLVRPRFMLKFNLPDVTNCAKVQTVAYDASLDARFEWKRLKEKDYEEVKALVSKHYSTELPMRKMYYIKQSDSDARLSDALEVQQILDSDVSVGIFEKTSKKLVAASLCETRDSLDACSPESTNTDKNVDFDSVVERLWFAMHEGAPAFLRTGKIYDLELGVVDSELQGMGLQNMMIAKSEQVAADVHCKYMINVASSLYAQKALIGLGFIPFNQVRLADYVDSKSGLKPFTKPSPPHSHLMAFYKEIGKAELHTSAK